MVRVRGFNANFSNDGRIDRDTTLRSLSVHINTVPFGDVTVGNLGRDAVTVKIKLYGAGVNVT